MSNRLRALREGRNLTQQGLGDLLNPPLPAVYIHRYESGKVKNIPTDILLKLSHALGVSTDTILGHAPLGAEDSATVAWRPQAGAGKQASPTAPALIDAALMKQCSNKMMAAARHKKLTLYNDEWLALTIALYNHVMQYRTRDASVAPNEAVAALILERHFKE